MIVVFVPDIPEFKIIVDGARNIKGCKIIDPISSYWRIESNDPMVFNRRKMNLGPALWNCLLSGGFIGEISEFSRDTLVLQPANI
mgnify:CR=1 FL=1